MGTNWKEAHVPGMIKKPRSAIGTVMTPSTIKSPIRKEGSEVMNRGGGGGRDIPYTSTQRDHTRHSDRCMRPIGELL